MGRIAGRLGRLKISDDGGATFTLIGCIIDASLAGAIDELETTCHEDGQNRTYIAGKRDATIDASAHWDEADAGQVIVRETFFGTGEGIKLQFRMQEGTGFREFEADAIITSYSPSSPNDDVADVDLSFRLSGAIGDSAQP